MLFRSGDDKASQDDTSPADFSAQLSLGACPKCGARVFEHGKSYVCEKSVAQAQNEEPVCDFKSGQIILQQVIEREQMSKLLETGKTDMLEKFISNKTRRPFKAMLRWDAEAGKVGFEFAPSKFPPRAGPGKSAAASASTPSSVATKGKAVGKAAKPAKKVSRTAKPARQSKASDKSGWVPSEALAAVIGPESVARPQVIKKLWDYIKNQGLQDARDKRTIRADEKLLKVFGKEQVSMFEIAGIVGKHLGKPQT